ncbi:hypothetical protein FQN49_005548 [Arthroderma sp. PD_2]|nr:hypothetical protein FQN49_005548 [Arthroderma sp. PD_2]
MAGRAPGTAHKGASDKFKPACISPGEDKGKRKRRRRGGRGRGSRRKNAKMADESHTSGNDSGNKDIAEDKPEHSFDAAVASVLTASGLASTALAANTIPPSDISPAPSSHRQPFTFNAETAEVLTRLANLEAGVGQILEEFRSLRGQVDGVKPMVRPSNISIERLTHVVFSYVTPLIKRFQGPSGAQNPSCSPCTRP